MSGRRRRRRLLAPILAVLVLVVAGTWVAGVASAATPLPPCRIADTLTKYRGYADWWRSLVDPEFRLASTYAPGDLRSTSYAGLNGGYSVRKLVIADLKAMYLAAAAVDRRFSVQSAYRSYATQQATFAYWVKVHGWDVAIKESARAGHSEHQLGTTLDFRSYGGRAPWEYDDWALTRVGAWMKANAWKFGFIMSYPKDKTNVTCYTYEPWHYRYVGRDRAKAIRASGLTLREFLWREQTAPTPTPTPTSTPAP